jgi:hypothetical protein
VSIRLGNQQGQFDTRTHTKFRIVAHAFAISSAAQRACNVRFREDAVRMRTSQNKLRAWNFSL